MALMNDDGLDLVSGGQQGLVLGAKYYPSLPELLNGPSMLPADGCPAYSAYFPPGICDCINCEHYDYHITDKCTNPNGIRFGK